MVDHKKLYDKSPSIKKDEDGKPGIQKPTKATGEDIGTEGNPLPGSDGKMPIDTHQAEHEELAKRHVKELEDMHKRHKEDYHNMNKRHHKALKADGETTTNEETK